MSVKYNNCGFLFGIVFMIIGMTANAQVVSSIQFESDSVQLGDPIRAVIKVTFPPDAKIESIDFSSYKTVENQIFSQDSTIMDRYADIDILNFGDWQHADINQPIPVSKLKITEENGRQLIQNTITFAIYNVGVFGITGPKVNVAVPIETLPSAPKNITVVFPQKLLQKDSVAINPIKDILEEKANISDYLTYIYILIALVLLGGLAYYLYKKGKNRPAPVESLPVVVELPAHQKALNALKQLDAAQLWQQGKIKDYQTGLTDIIRSYIEDRYGVFAPEMTTGEIITALRKVDFNPKYEAALQEILQVADLVKFAKATPDEDIHSSFMTKAVDFVEQTKITSSEIDTES